MSDEAKPQAGESTTKPEQDTQALKPEAAKPQGSPDKPQTQVVDKGELVSDLRAENAARRVENRELKAELETLRGQVAKFPDFTLKLSSLEAELNQAKKDKESADMKATRATVQARYGLPDDVAKVLENIPADQLEATAKVLAQNINKESGWRSSLGVTGTEGEKSVAQRVYERIKNRGGDAFDPAAHKAKGGGPYSEE